MTCVIALEHDGKIFMAGDSYCGTVNIDIEDVNLCDVPKVSIVFGIPIGICGSVKTEHVFLEMAQKHFGKRKVTRKWIEKHFSEIVRKELKKRNILKLEDGVQMMPDQSSFLLGVDGEILLFDDDFAVRRSPRKFACIGIGAPWANGAMSALIRDRKMAPGDKILKALKVSSEWSPYVRAPFHLINS